MDPLQSGDPAKVGNYRLLGRLGEGGMGRVYLGLSPGGRQVAVKLIHASHANGTQFRQRFAREIEAARQVGGFHTAPMVDADPDADPPWMVTAYIQGPSLQGEVTEHGPLGLDQLRALGAGLAEGLAAIHACGLVHRDLKPSNVILAEDGPRIIDFGIARAATASRMTTAGMVVGTFSYMSPEQISGELAGPPSDVFSLGCTLAFAATARTPFGEESIITVARRITSEPPDLAGVPEQRGFRELVADCLAKSPGDRPNLRYVMARLTEDATDEAAAPDDMAPGGAFDAGGGAPAVGSVPSTPLVAAWPEPGTHGLPGGRPDEGTQTVGRGGPVPLGPPAEYVYPGWGPTPRDGLGAFPGQPPVNAPGTGRPGRRVSRSPVLIAAGVALIVLLGAGLGILLTTGGPAKPHASGRQSSPSSPSPSPHPTGPPPSQPAATFGDPKSKGVFGVVFTSDSALAAADSNGHTYLRNVPAGNITATLSDPNSRGVAHIAFSQKGNSIAAADNNGSVYLWDVTTGKVTGTLTAPSGNPVYGVAFSPKGNSVAMADSSGSTYLWDVATSTLTATLSDPKSTAVYDAAFSPDGSRVATADHNGSVYEWNAATGKLARTLHGPGSKTTYDVAFNPDGSLLAATDGTVGGSIYLWDAATGKLVTTLRAPGNIGGNGDMAFSPDGSVIAVANGNGSTYLWKVATGKLLATLHDPGSKGVIGVAFSPHGARLAAADYNGSVYLWSMSWLGF